MQDTGRGIQKLGFKSVARFPGALHITKTPDADPLLFDSALTTVWI